MPQDWLFGLLGGALIGLSAVVLFAGVGRIAGICGIAFAAVSPADGHRGWRVIFLVGLVAGAWLAVAATGNAPRVSADALGGVGLLATAGALVGIGTRMGNGCTSGHGVCGMSRLSTRSIAATAAFMAAGMVTASLLRPLLELPS